MKKIWAFIVKDFKIMTRDRLGLLFMFLMPIVLAVVITAVQNSSFELVNNNKIPLIINNNDKGEMGVSLIKAINATGLFKIKEQLKSCDSNHILDLMEEKDALVAIVIPEDYSKSLSAKSNKIASQLLKKLGLNSDSTVESNQKLSSVFFYYNPVLQSSFRQSISGSLQTVTQVLQSKKIIDRISMNINGVPFADSTGDFYFSEQPTILEIPASRSNHQNVPNATQHNIPAWTVFAMFFIVISLGSSIVREKLSGSFLRIRTLPTPFYFNILSKQITYLIITMLQAILIFSIGIFLFPMMGLPKLILPVNLMALFVVIFFCGWCAVSYAICIGVFAKTQEQSNGVGAVSVVLMAAIGGILVPSFAMPESFKMVMIFSPLHWCMEAFYELFLVGGSITTIIPSLIPLFCIILAINFITFYGLNKKRLI